MISEESVKYSLRNLKQRKTRSAFTIISILVGIATIFVFISFGLGLYSYIDEMSSSSSADKVLIQTKGLGGLDPEFAFSENELEAVKKTSGVFEASGIYLKSVEIEKSEIKKYTFLVGYDPKKPLIMDVFNIDIEIGRELQPGDSGVVLGYNYLLPDKIFSKPYALNDNIIINGKKVKIVGFYEAVGSASDDAQIYATSEFLSELYPNEELPYNW
ncbi:MAG TPA: ABC transporter permease, partial [Candidatus Pacearchaeota archaeon]|nr:ABC transporter permease [Candidatus Pacearchaeota archaeon]